MGFRVRQIAVLTLVAAVVAVTTSVMNASLLVRSRVREVCDAARVHAQGLALQAVRTVREPGDRAPLEALRSDPAVRNQIDAVVGYSPIVLYVAVADVEGIALVHSNPGSQGSALGSVESLDELADSNPLSQLARLGAEDTTFGITLPLTSAGHSFGSVQVAVSALLLRKELFGTIAFEAIGATVVVLLALLVSLVLTNWLLAPIQRLREELARIDTGEGRPRLDLRGVADVERIAEFFATVGRSLAGQRPRATSQRETDSALGAPRDSPSRRLDAMGQMASAVAHQLRNPLNGMILQVGILRERADGEAQGHLDLLEGEVRRLDEVIQGFLRLARPAPADLRPVRLEEILGDLVQRWAPQAEAQGVRLEWTIEPDLPSVAGNPELLNEALANIMTNALDAMADGGSVHLAAGRHAGGGVSVSVRDSGNGIPADLLSRVFDPYFTTKEKGTGIGLPLVKRIAELHGGEVRIHSSEGYGTSVILTLPASPA